MTPAPRFAMIGNMELNGVFRGRSFPIENLDKALSAGMPWVPANVTLSASNTLPPDNPFGPVGETKFLPDPSTRVILPARDERPAMAVLLADLVNRDGSFWPACARGQLKRALADLAAAGFTLNVGFEQELYISGLRDTTTPAFSLSGSRTVSAIADDVLSTLATAGTRLDQFMKEFGENQYEISQPVRPALRAADEAVLAREVIRDAAWLFGCHATFAPKPDVTQPGSGVHIHMSLWDSAGHPQTAHNDGLTPASSAFIGGIIKYFDAVMAFTTPSPNSFQRLTPSSWVGVYKCMGIRNREAAVRLVPRAAAADGSHPGASIEFRVADGAATPYLALAAVIRAGLAGIEENLEAPESVDQDPARFTNAERAARGIVPLIDSLEGALAAAEPLSKSWFGEGFWPAYSAVRRNEINDAANAGEKYPAQFARVV